MKAGDFVRITDRRPDSGSRYVRDWETGWGRYLGTYGYVRHLFDPDLPGYCGVICDDGYVCYMHEDWLTKIERHPYVFLGVGDKVRVVESTPSRVQGNYFTFLEDYRKYLGKTGVVRRNHLVYRGVDIEFEDDYCNSFHYLWLAAPVPTRPLYVVLLGPRAEPTAIPEVYVDAALAVARAVELGGEAVELAVLRT